MCRVALAAAVRSAARRQPQPVPAVPGDAQRGGQRLPQRRHERVPLSGGHDAQLSVVPLEQLVLLHDLRVAAGPALKKSVAAVSPAAPALPAPLHHPRPGSHRLVPAAAAAPLLPLLLLPPAVPRPAAHGSQAAAEPRRQPRREEERPLPLRLRSRSAGGTARLPRAPGAHARTRPLPALLPGGNSLAPGPARPISAPPTTGGAAAATPPAAASGAR